jgi:hypothetical protein
LQFQHRGHYLTGGQREQHFHLCKTWTQRSALVVMEGRSVRYGEWLSVRHTIVYIPTRPLLPGICCIVCFCCLCPGSLQERNPGYATLEKLSGPSNFIRRDQSRWRVFLSK